MERWLIVACSVFVLNGVCWCLPVIVETTTTAAISGSPPRNRSTDDWDTGLEYDRYLKEIVNVLEDDEEFRKKMEGADPEHFKTGEIAKELNFLSHNVRTKLDEVKRQELTRLRGLMKERSDRNDPEALQIPGHLDDNVEQFGEEDLKRLIKQTTADLAVADEVRKKDFKEYEMDKEHLRREKLKSMDERSRLAEEQRFKEQEKQHKEHPKLHHPGSKAQLEEVWEETDGLPKEEFNPKTFFKLHDLNEDGMLDQGELEALFQKELDKIYDPTRPEDDMRERVEEMARMREHVMKEIDKNHDGMVSFDEFMAESKRQTEQGEPDPGWETIDQQQPVYSENDLKEYERQYEAFQGGIVQGVPVQNQLPHGGYNPNINYPGMPNLGPGGHQYPGPGGQQAQIHQGQPHPAGYNDQQHNNGGQQYQNHDPNALNSVNIAGGHH
ncbi:Nucleobindin-2 [Hypsibius exemplaris]|uniref:Nucleobindin-2 n=1 Tax=Hypsibius exemplaris TaxID=2072580 RepID=A0A1W0X4P2_HYPEX|nr:Nucleobindin-2 [Hypsibius exemplaris]